MKNEKAVLHPETGKIVYCAEWPLASNRICQRHSDGIEKCQEVCYFNGGALKTCEDRQIQQAIANGIEFKDQHKIKWEIYCSLGKQYNGEFAWSHFKLEPLKPYAIPETVTIEINYWCKIFEVAKPLCTWKDNPNTKCKCNQFAFIERQPKEETQDKLINDFLKFTRDYLQCEISSIALSINSIVRIERIK